MEHRGYVGSAQFSEADGVFHGRVQGIRDVVSYEGTSVAALRADFEAAVDDYLAMCAERGEEPERPFPGKFLVRTSPDVHRAIATAVAREGKSLNAWVAEALRRAAG